MCRPEWCCNSIEWCRYIGRQIKAEQDALALYSEEAVNGADTDLQELARNTVPKLRQRLVSLELLHASRLSSRCELLAECT